MMDGFPIEPSAEFVRLNAERETLWNKIHEYRGDLDSREWKQLWAQYDALLAACRATPEQQYLDDLQDAEMAAWQTHLAKQLEQNGRMMSVITLDDDGVKAAPDKRSFADRAIPGGLTDPFMVCVDTARMSQRQVAEALRALADRIDKDGMLVYVGPNPERPGFELWIDERPDGGLIGKSYRPNGSAW